MEILYLYVKFIDDNGSPISYRGFQEWSLNFSRDRNYYYKDGKIEFDELEHPIPQDFWGTNGDNRIYNISALVGDN